MRADHRHVVLQPPYMDMSRLSADTALGELLVQNTKVADLKRNPGPPKSSKDRVSCLGAARRHIP